VIRALRAIGAAILFMVGWLRSQRSEKSRERIVPAGEPDRRAELVVVAALFGVAGCAITFIVLYALDVSHETQWLGLSLGVAFALLAFALLVVANRLIVTEQLEEDYPQPPDRDEQERVVQIIEESGSKLSRRRLIAGAGAAAGSALGAALVVPAASMGPVLDTKELYSTPWERGRRLVDERGKPYQQTDIETDTFYTAFPEGADREALGSPLVVVRMDPAELELPPERAGWAPGGILAFSKICTHAGCAVALYRTPLNADTAPGPALVCPCHYSTFDPADGGSVIAGPAGRDLPQLPLMIDANGGIRAAGTFNSPVGPSFWGVRTRRPD
jgi:ubiquinol-cytochrome c reductase iron-sulfur subunit